MEKLYSFLTNLELIDIQAIKENEAFASVNLNPNITWAKFTLTDDMPNGNKKRVPQKEFANLVSTGTYMPIKMEQGTSDGDHPNSSPLGSIAHLKTEGNMVKGLAALWNLERPDDVQLIKEEYASGKPLKLSWEIAYSSVEEEENGVEALIGTSLMATTIVGRPAYGDRTKIEALSSVDTSKSEDNNNMELQEIIDGLKVDLEKAQAEKSEVEQALQAKASELDQASTELEELRAFKAEIEKEKLEAEKIEAIKAKFAEAKLEKEDEYFEKNKELLLSMDEATFNFMLQEMAVSLESKASKKSESSIPALTAKEIEELSIEELVEGLKALKENK